MAKRLEDTVLDASLDRFAEATIIHVLSAEPTSFADLATNSLADVVVDGADFTKANGDTSGRKVTVAAQSGITVDTSGTATHIGYGITTGSVFLGATTCTSQVLTSGNTVNIPAHDYEQGDPT